MCVTARTDSKKVNSLVSTMENLQLAPTGHTLDKEVPHHTRLMLWYTCSCQPRIFHQLFPPSPKFSTKILPLICYMYRLLAENISSLTQSPPLSKQLLLIFHKQRTGKNLLILCPYVNQFAMHAQRT